MKFSMIILLLSLAPLPSLAQTELENVEWKKQENSYFPFGNEFSDGNYLYCYLYGTFERHVNVYDKETYELLNRAISQDLQIPGLKKTGKFKVETICADNNGVYAVGRMKNKSTKLHEIWSIPLRNSTEVFDLSAATKVFEAKSIWFQRFTESSLHDERPFFVVRYPKPNEDGSFDSEVHQLGVFDPANGDKVWSMNLGKSEGKSERSKLVIEEDVIAFDANNKLVLSDFILNENEELDLQKNLHKDENFDFEILGFRKTTAGYTAAIVTRATTEEKDLIGKVYLLPFSAALSLKEDKVQEWDLFENRLDIDTLVNIRANLNQDGDLFIFSNNFRKNKYDVFILNHDGEKFVRSIPCRLNEQMVSTAIPLSIAGSVYEVKTAIGTEKLYLLYMDNQKNLNKYGYDLNSFDRRQHTVHVAPQTNEGGVFTCLEISSKGDVQLFRTITPARTDEASGLLVLNVTTDKIFILDDLSVTSFDLE